MLAWPLRLPAGSRIAGGGPQRPHAGARATAYVVALLLFVSSILAFTPPAMGHEALGAEPFLSAEHLLTAYIANPSVQEDGVVGPFEYNALGHWEDPAEGAAVFVEHDDTSLHVAIVTGAGGWAAFGFGPPLGEEGANGTFDVTAFSWNGTAGIVEDRSIPVLTDEFDTVPANGTGDVLGFGAARSGSATVFEARLALDAVPPRAVAIEPGTLVPFFVAFGNATGIPPASLAMGDLHLFRLYLLRASDDPARIMELFEGTVPPGPVPTLVAVSAISLGLVWLGRDLLSRRRGRGT